MTELLDPTLAGCTMLVTADRRAGELGGALQRRGAAVRYAPALSMVPNESDALLVAATRDLLVAPPDIAVVTTGIGFRAWIEAADAIGLAEPLLASPDGRPWTVLWNSEDPRYGGCGAPPVETEDRWRIPGHTALVLVPGPRAPRSDADADEGPPDASTAA